MRRRAAFILIACAFSTGAFAQTQAQMTQKAIDEFNKVDAQLKATYERALKDLDADARAKLESAERAWIAYRDAEAEFEANNLAGNGTMMTQIRYSVRTELTHARIEQLKEAVKKE